MLKLQISVLLVAVITLCNFTPIISFFNIFTHTCTCVIYGSRLAHLRRYLHAMTVNYYKNAAQPRRVTMKWVHQLMLSCLPAWPVCSRGRETLCSLSSARRPLLRVFSDVTCDFSLVFFLLKTIVYRNSVCFDSFPFSIGIDVFFFSFFLWYIALLVKYF